MSLFGTFGYEESGLFDEYEASHVEEAMRKVLTVLASLVAILATAST